MNQKIRILNFDDDQHRKDLSQELSKYLKTDMLFPVLGAGFTVGELTKYGKFVPSGKDLKNYMLSKLKDIPDISEKLQDIEKESFSIISTIYTNFVPENIRRDYIKEHFIGVRLSAIKQNFLSIPFQNIYTLNIDDAIEGANGNIEVFLNNRPEINDEVLASLKSEGKTILFKLHGDASEQFKYGSSLIFNQQEYVASLSKNKVFLNYLSVDLSSNCPLFIGCSLDDEIDLLYSVSNKNVSKLEQNTYYVTHNDIDVLMELKLKQYGIDTVIKLSSALKYDEFYIYLKDLSVKALSEKKLQKGLSYNPSVEYFKSSDRTFEEDFSYLVNSSFIYRNFKEKKIVLPSFFISRDILSDSSVIDKIKDSNVTVIYGHRYSGKTFALLDIYQKFSSYNKIFIPQNTRADSGQLIQKFGEINDSTIFIDANKIDEDIIDYIVNNQTSIIERKLRFLFTLTSADKENLFAIYRLEKLDKNNFLAKFYIKNYFSTEEVERINNQLDSTLIGKFKKPDKFKKITILDNIYRLIQSKGIRDYLTPNLSLVNKEILGNDLNPRIIVLLINLALNNGVMTIKEVDQFGLEKGTSFLDRTFNPLVQFSYIDEIERDFSDNSAHKFLCNSNIWLLRELQRIASYQSNHEMIVKAYQIIVRTINEIYSNNPRRQRNEIGNYIKFDEINDIFSNNNGARQLIDKIYEGLFGILRNNIQYFHQRAKSLSWGDSRNEDLDRALEYIDKAKSDFEVEFANDYITKEAYKHICYTRAIILSKLSRQKNYRNNHVNGETIKAITDAFSDPEKSNLNYIVMSNELGEPNAIITFIKRILENQNYDKNYKIGLENLSTLLIKNISTPFNHRQFRAKKQGRRG